MSCTYLELNHCDYRATDMNEHSSRSHAIFIITIECSTVRELGFKFLIIDGAISRTPSFKSFDSDLITCILEKSIKILLRNSCSMRFECHLSDVKKKHAHFDV